MTTDISEKGLETLIMEAMTGEDGFFFEAPGAAKETPDELAAKKAKGSGWIAGNPKEFDRAHAVDVPQLFQFLLATQPDELKKLGIANYTDGRDINRQKFLARVSSEIGKRGVIDVLRKGI
ncbi:MAG: DEAD/DEAH box helicase, partial [Verrucomicrobia bacterium]